MSFNKSTWPQRVVEYYEDHIKNDPWKQSTNWTLSGGYTCGADPYRYDGTRVGKNALVYHDECGQFPKGFKWPELTSMTEEVLKRPKDWTVETKYQWPVMGDRPLTGMGIKEQIENVHKEKYISSCCRQPIFYMGDARAKEFHKAMQKAAANYPSQVDISKKQIEKAEKHMPGFIQSAIQSGDIKLSDVFISNDVGGSEHLGYRDIKLDDLNEEQRRSISLKGEVVLTQEEFDKLQGRANSPEKPINPEGIFTEDITIPRDCKPFYVHISGPVEKFKRGSGYTAELCLRRKKYGDTFRVLSGSYFDGEGHIIHLASTEVYPTRGIRIGEVFEVIERI